ncbi:transcription initiation factor TFIID subunit 2-like isoform X1 [Coffea arabica]|uniref:Transcription initiation factor TFIID subunit 2 n=2 Tax=Coffea arabica TaxID=13443 RepID=A0ABM4U862_COFAR|nr:transcription initiation factor TFIID subunit 2 isoform X1 [Coffea arabica]
MAKPKKSKNEEQKPDNSEAVVKHQKLCLSIDMEKRRIYGYTELEIIVPENGIVGLHADNLAIESVTVDGEPAHFEVFPHYLNLDNGDRWCSVSTATSAADAAGSVYLSSLERELVPNLLIMCSKSAKPDGERQGQIELDNESQPSAESTQNLKMVRIEYWVEKAETGIHFDHNVLHTDNQIRRARCWFPCMDDNLQHCSYDLEFTVACNFVAVSSGTLLYQVLSKEDPPRKTYVYKLNIPVAARWISLAVAPFEIVPDRHNALLSHICLPTNLSKLQNTLGFFHSAFSYYEEYLSASFPFGCYAQVFIAPEMAISSLSLGASISIFSSQLLFDEKVIDQTIETRIKLAYALARQWFGVYITPEAPTDDWLLDGLAGFLTDSFVKRFLGNNEARYRRYKANCGVCGADDSGATALCSSASSKDLYGTQCFGFYGKIRSWKSVAVLQMLEKQMGPESFRKILQVIVVRAQDTSRPLRTLSTKEFRHFANKVGNLERPFLKEFFPRWVGSCGCPVLKMGFSYNKRKNMIELAVLRGCTARPDPTAALSNANPDSEKREGDVGWPGMMSIRVHELDGMYDHPILPMAGDSWQLLEIQCHSKLAAKRFQKPRKGLKPDGSDDNGDSVPALDIRSNSDSPLLWLRADPEMEYLAEIHFNQPVQMWVNQLEKDKDVVAQAQAIAMLEALPQQSFSIINALNNFLTDTKAFWRIRIEAAFALAITASEETDWAGLLHLIKFYKSRRFDPDIGLPKPNDFHDFQEYFVLEVIPLAIATVRTADKKSPREAVEFILQLLKYNDNNGNFYSDVFWLAALVQSIGELEFGQQTIIYLSSLLKRLDRLLHFDRLMPSYNGILTISCIRSLTQIAIKLSEFVPLDRVIELIQPFRTFKAVWQVRVEAGRALLDLEFQSAGIDAALTLFIKYLNEESSLRGQVKLGVHALRLCQMRTGSDPDNDVKSDTLVALLRLLESPMSFNNITLRHHLFCILQVLARRAPTLFGAPRDETLRMGHAETCSELKNIFAALVKQSKPPEPSLEALDLERDGDGSVFPEASQARDVLSNGHDLTKAIDIAEPDGLLAPEANREADTHLGNNEQRNRVAELGESDIFLPEPAKELQALSGSDEQSKPVIDQANENMVIAKAVDPPHGNMVIAEAIDQPRENIVMTEAAKGAETPSNSREQMKPVAELLHDNLVVAEVSKENDTVSNGLERKKPVFRFKVKHSAASSRAEDPDNAILEKSQDGHADADRGASSSVSVDAPQKIVAETFSTGNQNLEDVNSSHDVGSRVTASIGSAKLAADDVKELQCTADSSKVYLVSPPGDHISTSIVKDDHLEMMSNKYASLKSLTVNGPGPETSSLVKERDKKKDKKQHKEKKRKRDEHKGHRNDPEYLERKRLKKEKKRKEKELSKLMSDEAKASSSVELQRKKGIPTGISRDEQASQVEHERSNYDSETRSAATGGEGKAPPVGSYRKKDDSGSGASMQPNPPGETSGAKVVIKPLDSSVNATQSSSSHRLKIKIKKRTLEKPS